jgi:DNA topoisomerase-2
LYVKRKASLEAVLGAEVERLSAQARFVRMVVDGQLVLAKRKKAELVLELAQKGFPMRFKQGTQRRTRAAAES